MADRCPAEWAEPVGVAWAAAEWVVTEAAEWGPEAATGSLGPSSRK